MYHRALREKKIEVDRLTHAVGEHTRILGRHTNNPSGIRFQIRGAP
jgi:hypothetical protein